MADKMRGSACVVKNEAGVISYSYPLSWRIAFLAGASFIAAWISVGLWQIADGISSWPKEEQGVVPGTVMLLSGSVMLVWWCLSEANPARLALNLPQRTYRITRGIFPFLRVTRGNFDDIKCLQIQTRNVRYSNEQIHVLLLNWRSRWKAPILIARSNDLGEINAHYEQLRLWLESADNIGFVA